MELIVHSSGNEHPEIVEIEKAAFVRQVLVEDDAEGHVFDEEVDLDVTLQACGIRHHDHVHRGRCRRVEVVVRWNGNHEHEYGPATTVKTVEKWAFGKEVADFSPEQAAKHVLAVPGADHFLDTGVHVGSLFIPGSCSVVLDLLPRSRFEG
jgi:EAL domain-containing protein (putative c-di-GMP-specific phosphodiesterase class I)